MIGTSNACEVCHVHAVEHRMNVSFAHGSGGFTHVRTIDLEISHGYGYGDRGAANDRAGCGRNNRNRRRSHHGREYGDRAEKKRGSGG